MVSNEKMDSPINKVQQLMAITAEECGELTQVCMKIMRKYKKVKDIKNDKYRDLLVEELGDVQCMIELMIDNGIVSHKEIAERSNIKRDKLKVWSDIIDD